MGRIIGIDYGDSRIGLALSDLNKIIASPFQTIPNQGTSDLKVFLKKIVNQKEVEYFVLGLPIGLKGQDTNQTRKVRLFGEFLKSLGLPVFYQDERLSSISAKNSLIKQNIKTGKNKHMIDERAAAIILQQFLDINRLK